MQIFCNKHLAKVPILPYKYLQNRQKKDENLHSINQQSSQNHRSPIGEEEEMLERGESIGSKKEKREKCMLGMKELGLTPLLYALF